jgi:hypothetical protein
MASTQADLMRIFERPSPSQHVVAPRNPGIRDHVQYREGEYFCYAMWHLPSQIEDGEISMDTTDFLQYWMPSSLIFSVNMGTAEDPTHVWIVFHHADHDGKVVEFFLWGLQRPECVIDSDLHRVLQGETMLQMVCGRAYARSFCYKDFWPLYPKFVYLLFQTRNETSQGNIDSNGDD